MRSTNIVLLAVLAAVAPGFASPVSNPLAARTTADTPAAPVVSLTPEQSAALSLSTIGTIASVGGSIVGGIIDHFKNNGNQQQRRDALELEQLLARTTDESGAFSLHDASDIASLVSNGVNAIYNVIGGKKQRRDELQAREDDDSGAFSLHDASDIASLVSNGVNAIYNVIGNKKQRRDALELEQLFARDPLTDDESGAFSITSLLSKFLRREELEMLARQDESGAFTLKLPNGQVYTYYNIDRRDGSNSFGPGPEAYPRTRSQTTIPVVRAPKSHHRHHKQHSHHSHHARPHHRHHKQHQREAWSLNDLD